MMKYKAERQSHALIFQSADPNWPRFAVSIPGQETKWFKTQAEAVQLAERSGYPVKTKLVKGAR